MQKSLETYGFICVCLLQSEVSVNKAFLWPYLHLSLRVNVCLETEWYRAREIFKSWMFTIAEYSLQPCDRLAIQSGPRCWDRLQLSCRRQMGLENEWMEYLWHWTWTWLTKLVRSRYLCVQSLWWCELSNGICRCCIFKLVVMLIGMWHPILPTIWHAHEQVTSSH